MRNKIIFCNLIIIIMSLGVIVGFTNSRYYFKGSLTGSIDNIKTAAQIELYNPTSINEYNQENDYFEFSKVPLNFDNIHYSITNKVDGKINENEIQYYIRVVAEDGSDYIPIEYNVHKYNTPTDILNFENGIGYGPITLQAGTEVVEHYSIRANVVSKKPQHISDTQHLKVQMVRKTLSGTLKVMSEAPLNMKCTSAAPVVIRFFTLGVEQIGETKVTNFLKNTTIDFNNTEQLTELDIEIPKGYKFHDVRGVLPGYSGNATTVSIPNEDPPLADGAWWLEIYLSDNTVPLIIRYFTFVDNIQIGENVSVRVPKNTIIDFNNTEQLTELNIEIPRDYKFNDVRGAIVGFDGGKTIVPIPNEDPPISDGAWWLEIYLVPREKIEITFSYYDSNTPISKQTIAVPRDEQTEINFKNEALLSDLNIILPEGYKFNNATCGVLDPSWGGHDSFIIPAHIDVTNIEINVFLEKIIPVTFNLYAFGTVDLLGIQKVNLPIDTPIDFGDSEQLTRFGIEIPEGYSFRHIYSSLVVDASNNVGKVIKIPANYDNYNIELWLNYVGKIPIRFYIHDGDRWIDEYSPILAIPKGITIDFQNKELLESLGLILPENLKFNFATSPHLDENPSNPQPHNTFTIPVEDVWEVDEEGNSRIAEILAINIFMNQT